MLIMAAPKLYEGTDTKKLKAMAMIVIIKLVSNNDPACAIGASFRTNGYEGTKWIQKSTPETKKLVNISPMCKFG